MNTPLLRWQMALFLTASLSISALAQEPLFLREALYSGPIVRSSGRSAVFRDPVLAGYVADKLAPPKEGDVSGVSFRGETLRWTRIQADESGSFSTREFRGGYLYLTYNSDADKTVILQTNGNTEILVNGVPRAGDVYAKGWIMLPVKLKRGTNTIWFKVGRGRNKNVRLTAPRRPVFLTDVDMTVPDFLTNETGDKLGAIRVVNATGNTLDGLTIRSSVGEDVRAARVAGTVTPMMARKLPFTLYDGDGEPGPQEVKVSLYQDDALLDEITFSVMVKEVSQAYKRTFLSMIDGSVQYYAVREGQAEAGRLPAMFLSAHGAGVKALGQAGSYQPKEWGHVIAPTNRREFGFDWEDWGRLDAMEALELAQARYGTDPQHTYLTGHSMGGHGTWYLGATYPDRWAAIAPMSGWRSFFSYAGTEAFQDPTPMEAMLNRAANPSRTLTLARNYLHYGVFIEHGSNDNNVPVQEARAMRELLGTFHPDMAYHEEPGAGHWYGVDHQRVFDFLRWHKRKDIRDLGVLEFKSICPGISASSRYITLYQQEKPFSVCGAIAKQTIRSRKQRRQDQDISERTIDVTAENLRVFKIDLAHCRQLKKLNVTVDGQALADLPWPEQEELWLKREGEQWSVMDAPPDPREKNPLRYGGFKDAFRHNVVFVYGTGGHPEENDWAYHKARFDAETFYYRGNGSVDIVPDHAFTTNAFLDRSVILYGNASTNLAWPQLLRDSPVQVSRDALTVGSRTLSGDAWGIYMVRPRPDSTTASVGVVCGTGGPGQRAVVPNRYFVAGTGYPDLLIVSPDLYTEGVAGVVAAGYFGNDWSLEHGEIAWASR